MPQNHPAPHWTNHSIVAMPGSPSPWQESPAGLPGEERASEQPRSPEPSRSPEQQRTPSPTPIAQDLSPRGHWSGIPIDPDAGEDSGLEDDAAPSIHSLTESVLEYRTIQGRTYHSDRGSAEYWGSNDERQLSSMDLVHHAHTLVLGGKLYLAPIKDDIRKVVDIATGTGLWAIDFADQFPSCEVIGTDISPIQPSWVPSNLAFHIEDCTQDWTFAPESIDFVHMRYLTGSIQDWPALFREAFRCMRPGGYIQSVDAGGGLESDDGTVTEDSAMAQWKDIFAEGGKILGRTFRVLEDDLQRTGMEAAGFVEIEQREFKVPVGWWPKGRRLKEIGACTAAALDQDVEGYVLYMATLLGWTKERVTMYSALLRQEIWDTNIHGYYRYRVTWGKKPGA